MSMYAVAALSYLEGLNRCLLVMATDEKDAVIKAIKEHNALKLDDTPSDLNEQDYMIEWYESLEAAADYDAVMDMLHEAEWAVSKPILISKISK